MKALKTRPSQRTTPIPAEARVRTGESQGAEQGHGLDPSPLLQRRAGEPGYFGGATWPGSEAKTQVSEAANKGQSQRPSPGRSC